MVLVFLATACGEDASKNIEKTTIAGSYDAIFSLKTNTCNQKIPKVAVGLVEITPTDETEMFFHMTIETDEIVLDCERSVEFPEEFSCSKKEQILNRVVTTETLGFFIDDVISGSLDFTIITINTPPNPQDYKNLDEYTKALNDFVPISFCSTDFVFAGQKIE